MISAGAHSALNDWNQAARFTKSRGGRRRLRKKKEVSVWKNDSSRSVAGAALGAGASLGQAFGIVKLPTQNVLVLPSHKRGAIISTQHHKARAHSARSAGFDFSRRQHRAIAIEPSEIYLAFRRPCGQVTGMGWSYREIGHRAGIDLP